MITQKLGFMAFVDVAIIINHNFLVFDSATCFLVGVNIVFNFIVEYVFDNRVAQREMDLTPRHSGFESFQHVGRYNISLLDIDFVYAGK